MSGSPTTSKLLEKYLSMIAHFGSSWLHAWERSKASPWVFLTVSISWFTLEKRKSSLYGQLLAVSQVVLSAPLEQL